MTITIIETGKDTYFYRVNDSFDWYPHPDLSKTENTMALMMFLATISE